MAALWVGFPENKVEPADLSAGFSLRSGLRLVSSRFIELGVALNSRAKRSQWNMDVEHLGLPVLDEQELSAQ